MASGSAAAVIELTGSERERLEEWKRRRKTAQALALRAQIILESSLGKKNLEIARELHINRGTVRKWRSPNT